MMMETDESPIDDSCPDGAIGSTYGDAVVKRAYDESDAALQQKVVVAVGQNRQAVSWGRKEMTRRELIKYYCIHQEGKKDGLAFVLADMVAGSRKGNAVKAVHGVGLDIDVGMDGEEIDRRVETLGCLAIRYSTHSHLNPETIVPKDRMIKWCASQPERQLDPASDAAAQAYLREVKKYDEAIASTGRVGREEHTNDSGIVLHIEHKPIPKHRIIIPFKEPYVVADQGATQEEAIKRWKKVPEALAQKMGGLPLDTTGVDISRLFYLPRHAKNRPFSISLFGGPLFDWRTLKLDDPFAQLAEEMSQGKSKSTTPEGRNLGRWWVKAGFGFLAADMVRAYASDHIRSDDGRKLEVQCPFDDTHSNPGDPEDRACMVLNAGDGHAEGFVISCRHESCQNKTSNDMLGRWITEDVIPESVLEDEEFNALAPEGQTAPRPGDGSLATPQLPPSYFGDFQFYAFGDRTWVYEKIRKGKSEDDAPEWERLFTPWWITCGTRAVDQGNKCGLRVVLINEFGKEETLDINAGAAISARGADLKRTLREAGVGMTEQGEQRITQIFKQHQPADTISIYDRGGFRDVGFLPPWGGVIGSDRKAEIRKGNAPSGPAKAGDLESWMHAIDAAYETDVIQFQVGVLAGFAGPLIDALDLDSMWLAFTGSTSKGKSTNQRLMASVWGCTDPKKGLFGPLNGTPKSAEALMERASGTVYAFDEAHLVEGDVLQKLIFRGAGGSGDDRLTVTAELRRAKNWKAFFTLSGEMDLHRKITASRAAVATGFGARIIELNVEDTPTLSQQTMQRIEKAFRNHGHAGPAYIQAYFDAGWPNRLDELRALIDAKVDDLVEDDAMSGVRRSAKIVAVLWQAGVLAQAAGLLPADADMAHIARRVWALAQKSAIAPVAVDETAFTALRENLILRQGVDVFVVKEGEDIFEDMTGRYHKAVAWRIDDFKSESSGIIEPTPVYVVPKKNLSDLAGGALNADALAKRLRANGNLLPMRRADGELRNIWDYVPRGVRGTRSVVIPCEFVDGPKVEREPANSNEAEAEAA
jgi:hypothetical protein